MNKARLKPIVIVIAIGIVLGGMILTLDRSSPVTSDVPSTDTNEKGTDQGTSDAQGGDAAYQPGWGREEANYSPTMGLVSK